MAAELLWEMPVFFSMMKWMDFSVKPGVPNMYGAVGGEANAIKPGKANVELYDAHHCVKKR
jgi:hypothetical protein